MKIELPSPREDGHPYQNMNPAIFERKPTSRYFAVLRPTSGGSPSFQICECDIQIKPYQESDVNVMIVKNADIPNPNIFNRFPINVYPPERTDERICEYTMRNQDQSDIDIRNVKYWRTNHYFIWNEFEIPVLDFTKRFFLTRSFKRLIPYNKTSEEMMRIANAYASLRDLRIRQIEPSAVYGFSGKVFSIPPYVVELIVKDQIEKNNCCSITMNTFSGMQTFGLTPCFHLFEYEAIERWMRTKSQCPVCRKLALTVHKYEIQRN